MSTKINEKTVSGFFTKPIMIVAVLFLFIGFFLGAQYSQSVFGSELEDDNKYSIEKNQDDDSDKNDDDKDEDNDDDKIEVDKEMDDSLE